MAAVVVASGVGSVGAAGNGRRGIGGGSVWRAESAARVVRPRRHVLDPAGGLFSAVHAPRRACASSQHGTNRSDFGRSGRLAWRACVATIYARDAAARVAGRGGGDAAGICDCVRRICRFGAGVCSGESTDLDRDRIGVTRLQSRRSGGVRRGVDRNHLDQHDRGGAAGTSKRLKKDSPAKAQRRKEKQRKKVARKLRMNPFKNPRNLWLVFVVALLVIVPPVRSEPDKAELHQALLDLTSPWTVMCVAAHPDDEDGATLTILRRKYGMHTVSLFSTFGEGGQNAVGPELYEDLGVIRARETMAAAEVQGSEPHFLGFRDFGFSKSAEEAFRA